MIQTLSFSSRIGPILLAASERGLLRVALRAADMERERDILRDLCPGEDIGAHGEGLGGIREQLEEYLSGERTEFEVAMDLRGSPFRVRVWKALLRIGYGRTVSYRDVAEAVGNVRACRAVGQAIGANPVPIIVPCHRVIRSDGSLGGFGSGVDLKRRLLDLERASL
jgi:O-6-methylguanine DNA methyltransferase